MHLEYGELKGPPFLLLLEFILKSGGSFHLKGKQLARRNSIENWKLEKKNKRDSMKIYKEDRETNLATKRRC